jgi:hypothetical protein
MKTQHTPGKWSIDQVTLYRGEEMIIDESGKFIAGIHHRISGEEEKANAKLIAAAPEMLKILKMFLLAPGHAKARENTSWMFLDEIKEVIKEATE